MNQDYSERGDLKLAQPSTPELLEQARETLREMCDLLEEYGPTWYGQSLRDRAQSVLRSIEKHVEP